ncbi:hypothetical protein CEP54_015787, partial [Fusarium duplospermum]
HYMNRNDAKEVYKYYRRVCIPRFGHRAPNIDGKPVLNFDNLRVILTFNIAFDSSIFPSERHRISLAGCYQLLCYTGARPAGPVDGHQAHLSQRRRTIFFFTPTRKLLFCAVSTTLTLALHDDALDAPSLTTASVIFGSRPPSYMVSTPPPPLEDLQAEDPSLPSLSRGDLLRD